jgi:CHAT domain-containing protein
MRTSRSWPPTIAADADETRPRRGARPRSSLKPFFQLAATGMLAALALGAMARADPLSEAKQAREAYVQTYRETGRVDPSSLAPSVPLLVALAAASDGSTKARALYELGTIERMTDDYSNAAATLAEAAELAAASGAGDVAFDAWIGVARAQAYGTTDHAAAAVAYEHAVAIAGDAPTPQERYKLVAYRAQLELGRGETEAGLIDALDAQRIAPTDEDRLYSELDVGDALRKLAESCDYRPLIDERSAEPGDSPYDACRRAVGSGQAAFARAESAATALGWPALADQALQFRAGLDLRRRLIDSRAKAEAALSANVFSPRSEKDVLVDRDFSAGAANLTDLPLLADLAEQLVGEADARTGKTDARSNFMRGLVADIRGGNQASNAAFFVEAAQQLSAERGSFFDPRRRGTVIENRGEILQTLALRLLALGRDADAFAAFESTRARGLGEVAQAFSQTGISAADRIWFATLVGLEAQASKLETHIVRHVIASGSTDLTPALVEKLSELRAERQQVLRANEAARARFAVTQSAPVSLDALQAAAARANVPVVLYWSTYTNVVVWVVGPQGSYVRTVFIPQAVLTEKIRRIARSAEDDRQPFDEAAARELFLYLIAPIARTMDGSRIIIVPQGPLSILPFEALIDPNSGAPLIERWAVSYAPNASFAARALGRPARKLERLAALFDAGIDDMTHERQGIEAALAVREVRRADLRTRLDAEEGLHILFHGVFDGEEPLLSVLRDPNAPEDPLRAADMLAIPLAGRPLVVLSACESGRTGTRLSNEIYGFPWALLAGGAEAAVVSRWLVDGSSNSDWMRSFYAAMASGSLPSDAARTAMRRMRADGHAHPHFWAAMQVIGG